MIVLEPSGSSGSRDPDVILYYEVIDRLIGELEARFGESREVLSAVAACSPKANDFLNYESLHPLIHQYSLDEKR